PWDGPGPRREPPSLVSLSRTRYISVPFAGLKGPKRGSGREKIHSPRKRGRRRDAYAYQPAADGAGIWVPWPGDPGAVLGPSGFLIPGPGPAAAAAHRGDQPAADPHADGVVRLFPARGGLYLRHHSHHARGAG